MTVDPPKGRATASERDRPSPRDRALSSAVAGSASASEAAQSSYYGVPVIHQPHWKWLIVVYFFLGGIAGASYAIATFADLVGPREDRGVVRAGRYLSLAALIPCPILLILDLHRPERFYRMLRVLKFRSPMSVGTWGLTAFGGLAGLTVVAQAADDGLLGRGRMSAFGRRLPRRRLGIAGAPLALFVAGYTGPLLAATAVPLWTKRALLLGPLFLCSAFSTGVAAIIAVLALAPRTGRETLHRLERLERTAAVAELGILIAWLAGLGSTAKPIRTGAVGRLLFGGTFGGGLLLPLTLQAAGRALPPRAVRPLVIASSLLVLAGGFVLRYAVVVGGRASADDPRATFDLTQAGRR